MRGDKECNIGLLSHVKNAIFSVWEEEENVGETNNPDATCGIYSPLPPNFFFFLRLNQSPCVFPFSLE